MFCYFSHLFDLYQFIVSLNPSSSVIVSLNPSSLFALSVEHIQYACVSSLAFSLFNITGLGENTANTSEKNAVVFTAKCGITIFNVFLPSRRFVISPTSRQL